MRRSRNFPENPERCYTSKGGPCLNSRKAVEHDWVVREAGVDEKNPNVAHLDFLSGGSEMGRLMLSRDWTNSSVGSPDTWPQSLRTAVRFMLTSGHPMYIWWGQEGACLYNDAYRFSIGPERHPSSLGRPAREVWAEIGTSLARRSNR